MKSPGRTTRGEGEGMSSCRLKKLVSIVCSLSVSTPPPSLPAPFPGEAHIKVEPGKRKARRVRWNVTTEELFGERQTVGVAFIFLK